MPPVQIADLKNQLSAYLNLVRAGKEVIVLDRKTPIARIVPIVDDLSSEEESLVAAGLLKLPAKPFDTGAFFAIGNGRKTPRVTEAALQRALDWAREDPDAGVLGRKRRAQTVRARATK